MCCTVPTVLRTGHALRRDAFREQALPALDLNSNIISVDPHLRGQPPKRIADVVGRPVQHSGAGGSWFGPRRSSRKRPLAADQELGVNLTRALFRPGIIHPEPWAGARCEAARYQGIEVSRARTWLRYRPAPSRTGGADRGQQSVWAGFR